MRGTCEADGPGVGSKPDVPATCSTAAGGTKSNRRAGPSPGVGPRFRRDDQDRHRLPEVTRTQPRGRVICDPGTGEIESDIERDGPEKKKLPGSDQPGGVPVGHDGRSGGDASGRSSKTRGMPACRGQGSAAGGTRRPLPEGDPSRRHTRTHVSPPIQYHVPAIRCPLILAPQPSGRLRPRPPAAADQAIHLVAPVGWHFVFVALPREQVPPFTIAGYSEGIVD